MFYAHFKGENYLTALPSGTKSKCLESSAICITVHNIVFMLCPALCIQAEQLLSLLKQIFSNTIIE